MPHFPTLSGTDAAPELLSTFLGYHHGPRIAEGEFYDMENLTSDDWPMLSVRAPRALPGDSYADPQALAFKNGKPVLIDSGSVYYDGADTGLTVTAGDKQIASMGAYAVIFPDGVYFNTADLTDTGTIANTVTTSGKVTYTMCDKSGTDYAVTAQLDYDSPPDDPYQGQCWLDTSGISSDGGAPLLKRYDAVKATWVTVSNVYVKMAVTGIGAGFAAGDGVTISGADGGGNLQGCVNGTKVLAAVADDYLVVSGILHGPSYISSSPVTVTRAAPDMDYVVSCQNRLWGCRYDPSGPVNEIYACALGDFTNWEKYEGLSTDSYRASCGSDGPWTGAAVLNGYPLFWKADCVHRVFVSSAGAHQITETALDGVYLAGSLALVGSLLCYVARRGVFAFDGASAYEIGAALDGAAQASASAVGCAKGDKYYLFLTDDDGASTLFVYDTARGLWHKETTGRVRMAAGSRDELWAIVGFASPYVMSIVTDDPGSMDTETTVRWSATTGLMGYTDYRQKYVSRFSIRMELPEGSTASFWMSYDDGDWEQDCTVSGTGTGSFLLPIRPRRCDHFRLRLTGTGPAKVYSIARYYESGSDAV